MAAVTSFSWSDTVQIAFNSCLPCIKPKPAIALGRNGGPAPDYDSDDPQNQLYHSAVNRIPRARPDELQGLLADPGDDTDVDAERMSLHSNFGADRRRKKRKGKKKKNASITLFGYNLFGRAVPPPIHLDEDGDDALYAGPSSSSSQSQSRRSRKTSATSTSSSSSGPNPPQTATFDSDAAPLDVATINALSSPDKAAAALEASVAESAQIAAEAERRQREREEKEERRRRRRERKEMRRVAEALALAGNGEQHQQGGDGEGGVEFEGFQGSTAAGDMIPPPTIKPKSGYPRIPNTMYPGAPSDSGSEGFGRFVSGGFVPPPPATHHSNPLNLNQDQEDEDDAADLDGGMYARKPPRHAGTGGLGSDSRSRTSASTSDRGAQMFPDPRNVLKHLHSQSHTHTTSQSQSQSQSHSSRSHSRTLSLTQSSSSHSQSRMNSPSPYRTQFQPHAEEGQDPVLVPHPQNVNVGAKSKKSSSSGSKHSSSSHTTHSRSSPSASASASVSASGSGTSHSQPHSPSIPSPSPPYSPASPSFTGVISPNAHPNLNTNTIERGQGLFDLEDELVLRKKEKKKEKEKEKERKKKRSPSLTPAPTSPTSPTSPAPELNSTDSVHSVSAGDERPITKKEEFPSARIGGSGGGTGSGGFPMTGFAGAGFGAGARPGGGPRRTTIAARDFGAFLARRGDDADADADEGEGEDVRDGF